MDQSVTFTFWQGEQPVRYLNGIVTSFRFGEKQGLSVRIIKWWWSRLSHEQHFNLIAESSSIKTAKKIIRTLLQKNRVEKVSFEPLPSDWEREYCVQYRETD